MIESRHPKLPFNTALETGIRSVAVLVVAFPRRFDLHRLVAFDHLVVHTGDVGGPDSLHAAVPMRTAELLVRRRLVERGLLLMASRGLVVRRAEQTGLTYEAGEFAETFLSSLATRYAVALRERAAWVVDTYGELTDQQLKEEIGAFFEQWIEQFQVAHRGRSLFGICLLLARGRRARRSHLDRD